MRTLVSLIALLVSGCAGVSIQTPSGVHSGTVVRNGDNRIALQDSDGVTVINKCEIESVGFPGNAAIWTGLGVTAVGLIAMGAVAMSDDTNAGSPLFAAPIAVGGLVTLGIGVAVKADARDKAGDLECTATEAASRQSSWLVR